MSLPADQSYATNASTDSNDDSTEETEPEEETESESEELSESDESSGSSEEEGSSASVPATPSRTRVLPAMLNGFVNTNANTNASPASASDARPVRSLPARATRSTTAARASTSSNWTQSIGAFTRSLASPAKKGRLDDVQASPSSSTSALDGEEGEVIDEGVSFTEPGVNRVDFLCALPSEISAYILLHSDALTLCQARAVSRSWNLICSGEPNLCQSKHHLMEADNIVWRDHFYRNEGWQIKPEILAAAAAQAASADPFSLSLSRHPSSPSIHQTDAPQTPGLAGKVAKRLTNLITDLGSMHLAPLSPTSESAPPIQSTPLRDTRRASSSAISPFAPLPSPYHGGTFNLENTPLSNGLDWIYLYKQHFILDKNWAKGKARTKLLRGHEDAVYSIQKRGDILISGSRDKTIKSVVFVTTVI